MILNQVKRHPLGTLFDKKIREILGIDRNDGRTPTPKLFWTHFPQKNVFDNIMNLWEAIINCIITKKYSIVTIKMSMLIVLNHPINLHCPPLKSDGILLAVNARDREY